MQSFIMNSHEVFIHIHQGCFAGTRAIVRLPQCQWSKPDGYGKIRQCISTTKHSKAKTVCIFLGIYCRGPSLERLSEVVLSDEWKMAANFKLNEFLFIMNILHRPMGHLMTTKSWVAAIYVSCPVMYKNKTLDTAYYYFNVSMHWKYHMLSM